MNPKLRLFNPNTGDTGDMELFNLNPALSVIMQLHQEIAEQGKQKTLQKPMLMAASFIAACDDVSAGAELVKEYLPGINWNSKPSPA